MGQYDSFWDTFWNNIILYMTYTLWMKLWIFYDNSDLTILFINNSKTLKKLLTPKVQQYHF